MPHLRLVPPPAADTAPAATAVPEPRPAPESEDVAYAFFQASSGLCLCRQCTKERHPAYGAR